MTRKLIIALLVVVAVAVVAVLTTKSFSGGKKDTYFLGLAAPLTGEFKDAGLSMKRGVALAVKEMQESGELGDLNLELQVGDDQSVVGDAKNAVQVAKELTSNEKLLGVVGHYFSQSTIEADKVYIEKKIPVITPTSTHPDVTAGSDWTFSVIFDDAYQGSFLANYVLWGLGRQRIAVIHATNLYSVSLKDQFVKELARNRWRPSVVIEVPLDEMKGGGEAFNPASLQGRLQELQQADIIFIPFNYKNAAKLVRFLKNKGIRADFIGPESVGGDLFVREAGVYADNVYAITPFLPNLYGEEARLFQMHFLKEYQTSPDWIATYAYEAVRLYAKAIKEVGPDREGIKNALARINSEANAMPSIAGDLYFNSAGSTKRAIAIGQVKEGTYQPARFQITPVKFPELVRAQKDPGIVFYWDGRMMKRTTLVFTGLHVKEIREFDPIQGSFKADFLLWFRWDPNRNPKLSFEMTHGRVETVRIRDMHQDAVNKNNFIMYDVSATMKDNFNLEQYPFDKQTLRIRIMPKFSSNVEFGKEMPEEDVMLITDISDDSYYKRKLDFGSWEDIGHIQFTGAKDYIWSYRSPKFNGNLYKLDHSIYSYNVHMQRKVTQFVVTLLPLLVIVVSAYLTFFISYEYVASRISLGITSMLSAMAFHGVNKIQVGYLVKSDVFFMLTYWLIFFSIMATVVGSAFHVRKQTAAANRVDTVFLVAYPFMLLGVVLYLFS
ncbi:MAG: ABC transporter substrate-binding protein [Magnetococcales bacterium]|nr:ABC transporter substrate-binding protein [Magnetococcales bacterium]